jgi:hypothetical protein
VGGVFVMFSLVQETQVIFQIREGVEGTDGVVLAVVISLIKHCNNINVQILLAYFNLIPLPESIDFSLSSHNITKKHSIFKFY